MPKSRHRRSGKNRPRSYETHAPQKRQGPSPSWVPATGVALLVVGTLIILLGYLPTFSDIMQSWPVFGPNWGLIVGFVTLTTGLGFLMRWR